MNPPGIGKSALVRAFAASVGLPCVSLLGSRLAPEDMIGVPQIIDGRSRFCPTRHARQETFAAAIRNSVEQAIRRAGDTARGLSTDDRKPDSLAERARSWFVAN